jgi:photosystem II stability/assembly factor-like uncharacterized protein
MVNPMKSKWLLPLLPLMLPVGCEKSTTPSTAINGTWGIIYEFGAAYAFRSMFFMDQSTGWIVGPGGTIMHTTDGGTSFESQNSGTAEDLFCVCFNDAESGWAVGRNNTVLRTSDGGTSWTPVHVDDDSSQVMWSVRFVSANKGWLLSNHGKLYGTQNAGETWNLQLTWQSGGAGLMYFIDEEVGFVRPGIGDVWYRTSDGGSSWSTLSLYADMRWEQDMFFVDRMHGWICNNRLASSVMYDSASVFRIRDGGESWELAHRFPELCCNKLFFLDENNGWVAANEIYYTPDGGNVWVRQTDGGDRVFIGLQFVGASAGYALDYSGTLFKFQPE